MLLRLAPCEPETGWGTANCVAEPVAPLNCGGGGGKLLDVDEGFRCGEAADWKSSNSSSMTPPDCKEPISLSKAEFCDLGALAAVGIMLPSSSPTDKRSTSGALGFGGSEDFFTDCSVWVRDDVAIPSARRLGVGVAPSSNSSYSSNRSLRALES